MTPFQIPKQPAHSLRLKEGARIVPKSAPLQLSPDDLREFRLRSAALQQHAHEQLMIQESYQSFIKALLAKYGLSGKYDVDSETGELRANRDA